MLITRRSVVFSILATLPACSSLSVLNTLGGADSGSRQAVADIAYGPDPRQRLDVYVPKNNAASQRVVIFYYGGSWNSGSKNDYAFVGRALASRGFVAVVSDYRLVPQVRFPSFIQDSAAVVRWTNDHIAEYGGSPKNIHIVGHSAGAYNALMITLDRNYLAAVELETSTLQSVVGLSGPYDFLPFRVDVAKAAFANASDQQSTQPISFARGDAPPILLATGDRDTTVEPDNTYRLAAALRKKHGRVFVQTYSGLTHVDTLLALSRTFRVKAPVLDDVVHFMEAAKFS